MSFRRALALAAITAALLTFATGCGRKAFPVGGERVSLIEETTAAAE